MEEPKNCPFCGNWALDCNGHFIECDKCGATGPKVYPIPEHDIVVKLWNTRVFQEAKNDTSNG